MIRRSILAVIVLAVGVVASVGIYQFRQVDAAPGLPVTIQDADVDADGHISILDLAGTARYYGQAVPNVARPVAEQNVDGNGDIKVHEQGTVNVNVVSSTVPRLIPIVTGASVAKGQTLPLGGFVNVSDCGAIDVYASVTIGDNTLTGNYDSFASAMFDVSLDGVTTYEPQQATAMRLNSLASTIGSTRTDHSRAVGNASWPNNGQPAPPYVRIEFANNVSGTVDGVELTDVAISLYCTK